MKTMKILIVDDEPHLRTLIQQTLEELEDEGVDLFTAGNGEEALETIRQEQPNLVFLDVMMPKKNGFDVCNAVKIPVIGMGGIASGEDAAEFLIAGAALVQVGTATFMDPEAPVKIALQLEKLLPQLGVTRVSDLVGTLRMP